MDIIDSSPLASEQSQRTDTLDSAKTAFQAHGAGPWLRGDASTCRATMCSEQEIALAELPQVRKEYFQIGLKVSVRVGSEQQAVFADDDPHRMWRCAIPGEREVLVAKCIRIGVDPPEVNAIPANIEVFDLVSPRAPSRFGDRPKDERIDT